MRGVEMAMRGDRLVNREAVAGDGLLFLFALAMIAVGIAMRHLCAAEGDPSGVVDLDRRLEMESDQPSSQCSLIKSGPMRICSGERSSGVNDAAKASLSCVASVCGVQPLVRCSVRIGRF